MDEEVEWSDGEEKCIHVKWSKTESKFFDSKSYSRVQKSIENGNFLEGGNEEWGVANPNSFLIFDSYDMKSL